MNYKLVSFHRIKFENIPSLQALKDERLRKEAYELKEREEKAKLLLDKLEILIAQRKCQEAKQIMDENYA